MISRCVAIKRDIVEQDETETGPRKLLNFGHTVGHAVEALSNFEISHGKAVAIGMAVMTRAAAAARFCPSDIAERLVSLLQTLGLPTETNFTTAELAEAALSDKKRGGGSITLIVPEKIGSCTLRETPVAELEHFIGLGL